MRRYRLLLLLLGVLLACAPARAQDSAAVARPVAVAAAPAPPDTAAALHHYFARRRHNGHVSLGVGGGLLATSVLTTAIGSHQAGWDGLGYVVLGVAGTVFSLPVVVRGIVLTVNYSEAQERRAMQAWQQHRLPNRLARRALTTAPTSDKRLR